MKIRIRNSINFVKYFDDFIEGKDLSNLKFYSIAELIKDKFKSGDLNLKYTIVNQNNFIPINDCNKTLLEYNFKEKDCILVEPKGKKEIDSYMVTVISYMGPPIFFSYNLISDFNLDFLKILAFLLIYVHFFRRIYESTYIFSHGRQKIAIYDLIGVTLYYWILNGYFISFSIFNSSFKTKINFIDYLSSTIFTIFFLYCEFKNCICHIYLANLKQRNNGQRAIPFGGMFEYVSCAHYFWELLAWLFFALIFRTLHSYLFVIYSFISMGCLSFIRHKNLIKFFGDEYPKARKAFIPYLI